MANIANYWCCLAAQTMARSCRAHQCAILWGPPVDGMTLHRAQVLSSNLHQCCKFSTICFLPFPLLHARPPCVCGNTFVPMPLQRSCSDSIRLHNSAFTLPSVLMLKLWPSFWCRKISHCNKEVLFRFAFSRPQIFLCPCPSHSSRTLSSQSTSLIWFYSRFRRWQLLNEAATWTLGGGSLKHAQFCPRSLLLNSSC